jgi:hypothetical protein
MKRKLVSISMIVLLLWGICMTIINQPAGAVPYASCLAYDSFNRSNGSIGVTETVGPFGTTCPSLTWAWSNSNWLISSNAAVGYPTVGNNDVTNGTFDADASWTKGTNWLISGGTANITAPGGTSNLTSSTGTLATVGQWYQETYDLSAYSAGSLLMTLDGGASDVAKTTNGSYLFTGRALFANRVWAIADATSAYSIDNIIRKPLTFASLFATVPLSTSNVIAKVNITNSVSTAAAGLILNMDSASSPLNFIVAYEDGAKAYLGKYVAGSYTALINATTITYVAGATLQVTSTRSGGNLLLDLKYNNATVGTQQTVADAGIVDNTLAGMFSSYSGNSLDNFYVVSNTANTATSTVSNTPSVTNTPTVTDTPTFTFTPSFTASKTYTPTFTSTWTFTPTFTFTPSYTATDTNTPTSTYTPSNTATITNTPTQTTIPGTATYQAAYVYYSGVASQNYPLVIVLSVIFVGLVLAGIVWLSLWLTSRNK